MILEFCCGVCGKKEIIELKDKNKTYLIGRDFEGLDVKLCPDEKSILSRIQAYIKWEKNAWRIFDGLPPENVFKQTTKIQKPDSFAGTFIKRGGEYKLLSYGAGEEIRPEDTIFFVITVKADRNIMEKWIKQAGIDAQAAFYKYDGFTFPGDSEYYEGFKYKVRILSGEEETSKNKVSNVFIPLNFSKVLETGKEHFNSCLGIDIRASTETDLETQRDYWIPQFNSILNKLLLNYKDYILILLGDGAYLCFLGNREEQDINFQFALKFLMEMKKANVENVKKRIPQWNARTAVNNGMDLLAEVNIAGQKSLNVYGNTITTTARLMSFAKSEKDDIICSVIFHQNFGNKKFYKTGFLQIPMDVIDSHGVRYFYYVYKKIK
ncbi:MAG: hypothetical protein KA120_00125 [Candidatus Goldbacteria bacterium]|nr:hypothetical protein [Candidatus Goldiibacteriota bacterium]